MTGSSINRLRNHKPIKSQSSISQLQRRKQRIGRLRSPLRQRRNNRRLSPRIQRYNRKTMRLNRRNSGHGRHTRHSHLTGSRITTSTMNSHYHRKNRRHRDHRRPSINRNSTSTHVAGLHHPTNVLNILILQTPRRNRRRNANRIRTLNRLNQRIHILLRLLTHRLLRASARPTNKGRR